MAKNKDKTYWPHMILGFLLIGITLSYWTVKSAGSLPVQESNKFMLKYQTADININEIMERKMAFDKAYDIRLEDAETMVMTDNINSNRMQENPVKLTYGANSFRYDIVSKNGEVVGDANVTFLLTRPHTRTEDFMVENVPFSNGSYRVKEIQITKPGRYTLQLRAQIGERVGYSEIAAYLQPK